MSSRYVKLQRSRGGRGEATFFCFPPAALRRFRRAKAASDSQDGVRKV